MLRVVLSLLLSLPALAAPASLCSFDTWEWDTRAKKSVNHRRVTKDRGTLDAAEKGTIEGCSVCTEDQEMIRIEGLPPFEVCRKFAEPIRRAVTKAKSEGMAFQSIVGYRVGKTKGVIDAKGLRTEFSNHSFGVAIDFNSETNGLYDACVKFGPGCKLLRGGPYDPKSKTAITPASPIYRAMRAEGLEWGGEIAAKQKDFMHFSPNGM